MIRGGKGGGNTTTGLNFEVKTDLLTLLESIKGYEVKKDKIGHSIFYNTEHIANSYRKHQLYKFLESEGVEWKKIVSKKLLPDDAIYVIRENTVYILEIKYQEVEGSVDEKLQTCGFKKQQYQKLFSELNFEVEFIYILNEWFKNPKYRDTLDFVISEGCQYYFEYLPLHKIGLPVPNGA